jgi:Rrf2 family protein
VTSFRGPDGGYQLARAAADISVADVITAMEGGVAMTECCESAGLCFQDNNCSMQKNWKKINKMVYDMLAKITVTDMLGPVSQMGLGVYRGK